MERDGISKGNAQFKRSSSCVSDIVKELRFIQSAIQQQQVTIDKLVLNINTQKGYNKIEIELNHWVRIKRLFKQLHIPLDLDISDFNNQDFRNIELLMRAILDKEQIVQSNDIGPITTISIGRYTVLLYAEKQKNGKYLIEDFFVGANKLTFAYEGDCEDQRLATSMFSLVINHDIFISFINIDYRILVQTYY